MKFKKQLQDETISNIVLMLQAISENYEPNDSFTNSDIRSINEMNSFDLILPNTNKETVRKLYNASFNHQKQIKRNISFANMQNFVRQYHYLTEVICFSLQADAILIRGRSLYDERYYDIVVPRDFFTMIAFPASYNPNYLKTSIDLSDVFTTRKEPISFEIKESCWCVAVGGKVVPESEAPQDKHDSKPFVATIPRSIETERYVYTYNREALEKAINDLQTILTERQNKRNAVNQAAKQTYDYIKSIDADIRDVIKSLEKLSKGK